MRTKANFLCGWISPVGEFFNVPKGTHLVWLAAHLNLPELADFSSEGMLLEYNLYKEGWIHVGSEGQSTFTTHESTASIRSKSFNYLTKWIKDNATEPLEFSLMTSPSANESKFFTMEVSEFLKKRRF